MKKWGYVTLTLMVGFFSELAHAGSVHRFDIIANKKIETTCQDRGELTTSRLAIAARTPEALSKQFTLDIKIKVCTKSFGFQVQLLELQLPTQILDSESLMRMRDGDSWSSEPLLLNSQSQILERIQIKALSPQNAESHALPILENSRIYEISWIPVDSQAKPSFAPIRVWLSPKTPALLAVPGFAEHGELPWLRILISHKVPVAGSFVIEGQLSRVNLE